MFPHKTNYDFDYIEDRDERCLCNSIEMQGKKVILINVDDQCQVTRYQREGIFIETGDIIIIAGSSLEYSGIDSDWSYFTYDCNVLGDMLLGVDYCPPEFDFDV